MLKTAFVEFSSNVANELKQHKRAGLGARAQRQDGLVPGVGQSPKVLKFFSKKA